MTVTVAIRTKRRHPYFFSGKDRSPLYVVQIDGKTVWVTQTRKQANSKAKQIREEQRKN
jgi:hypothetical protein